MVQFDWYKAWPVTNISSISVICKWCYNQNQSRLQIDGIILNFDKKMHKSQRYTHREACLEDLPHICPFPQNTVEFYYMYPNAHTSNHQEF